MYKDSHNAPRNPKCTTLCRKCTTLFLKCTTKNEKCTTLYFVMHQGFLILSKYELVSDFEQNYQNRRSVLSFSLIFLAFLKAADLV